MAKIQRQDLIGKFLIIEDIDVDFGGIPGNDILILLILGKSIFTSKIARSLRKKGVKLLLATISKTNYLISKSLFRNSICN